MVKFQVFPGISVDIFLAEGLLKSFDARFQLCEAPIINFLRYHGGSQPLQVFPNEKQFKNILFRKLDDESPSLGKNFNKSFLFKTIDRFPHRSPTDSQRFGDFALLDPFPRIQLAIKNNAFQSFISLASKRKIRLTNSLHAGSPKLYNLYIMHFLVSSFLSRIF